jgi:hypothetical protein
MLKVSVAVTVLGLTAAGCGFSSVDPGSSVSISGRALNAAGNPLGNARVVLVKQADLAEVVFGTVLTVGTLSTICFAPDPPAICERAQVTTTDADGRYHFEVKGSDVRGSLGTEATMNVVFSGRSSPSSTTVSFTAQETDVTVPDARVWDLAATVTGAAGRIRLTWRPLSPSAGTDTGYSAELYDARTGAALWSQPARGGQAELDPRLLEDRRGTVAASASAALSGGSGTGSARAGYLSARLPVTGSVGAPPSRGRPCAAVTGIGKVAAYRTPCAETDGNLGAPAQLSAPAGATVTGVAVDLGRTRPVDLVVARGFSGQYLVEISTDGRSWHSVATGSGTAYSVSPAGRPAARYVRVRSAVGLDESLSAEVSVW